MSQTAGGAGDWRRASDLALFRSPAGFAAYVDVRRHEAETQVPEMPVKSTIISMTPPQARAHGLIDSKEARARAGVSPSAFDWAVRSGKLLPCIQGGSGKTSWFSPTTVDVWAREHRAGGRKSQATTAEAGA